MIKLTNPLNKDGVLYEKGAILTLPLTVEQELIKNEVAETYPILEDDLEHYQAADNHDEVEALDLEVIKKMDKKELIAYALEINLVLNEGMKKPDMINAILDHVDEQESSGE